MSDIEYRLFDPKEDFIFKMIFGTEENKSILISLLNSILKGRPYINDVTLENNEISKIFKDGKSSRLDILATDDNGIKYDIEMQCRKTKDIINRTLFYASKSFAKDLKKNEDYNKSRVISIWIFGENITDELLDFMANEEKMCKYLDNNYMSNVNNDCNTATKQYSGKNFYIVHYNYICLLAIIASSECFGVAKQNYLSLVKDVLQIGKCEIKSMQYYDVVQPLLNTLH